MSRFTCRKRIRQFLDALGWRACKIPYELPVCTSHEEDEDDIDEQEEEVSEKIS